MDARDATYEFPTELVKGTRVYKLVRRNADTDRRILSSGESKGSSWRDA